jgi:hypothetical protein
MNDLVERIAEEVKLLDRNQMEKFLSWLSEHELSTMDEWDQKIAEDPQSGGRLSGILDRVRSDIAKKRTKPLDQFLNNS